MIPRRFALLVLVCAAAAWSLWTGRARAADEDERNAGAPAAGAASKSGLQLPELVHFEEAPYPAEAQAAGLEGDVVLRLTIDAKGNVTNAEVVTGAGNGFDDAARRAALKFKFKPALRKQKPIAVRLDYKYSFTLSESQPRSSVAEVGTVPEGSGEIVRIVEPKRWKRAGITPPQLVEFKEAVYPRDAWKGGTEADVTVRFRISARGTVSDVRVIEPAGDGFDEAASEAVEQFKFKPARRRRTAIAVRVDFKYSFRLGKVVLESDEPDALAVGELNGEVRNADSNTAVPGARITAVAEDGTEKSVTADANGKWSFKGLEPGSYRVRVDAAELASIEQVEEVTEGEATEVTYRLGSDSGGLEVTVEGERPPREVTKRTIERREIERIPGTSGDALRSLQSLPGVARPPAFLGLLIVRGSAPGDTQTFVDGANVPLIYHFLGVSSIVPTELLDRIDFYPGNYSVKYGRGMGGIVDVGLRSPDTRCFGDWMRADGTNGCYHGFLELDLINGRFLLQGPVANSKNWSFALAGRRSWVDAWITPVLESSGADITQAPRYYDYQLIVDGKLGPDTKLSLRGFGFDDRFSASGSDPAAQDPAYGGDFLLSTTAYTGQALLESKLARGVELSAMLSAGKTAFNYSVGPYVLKLDSTPMQARLELGSVLARGIKVNTGLDLLYAPYKATVIFPPTPLTGEPDLGPSAARPPLVRRREDAVYRPGAYAELELQPTRRLRIVPGLRLDYARDSDHWDLSPRFNARYDLVGGRASTGLNAPRRTTLKGGVGLFYQPPQFQETDQVFGTPGLRSNRSVHYSVGVEQELTRQVELSLEGFYKDLRHLIVGELSDDPINHPYFVYNNRGRGHVIGLEALLKYKPDKRFFGWIAYTLSRSVRRNEPGEDEYLFPYDQTHNLIVLGSYRLGRGWEFGARFRIVSGTLTTPNAPQLPALYDADAGAYVALPGKQFGERLPLFHQLDLRVDKRFQFRHWRLTTYLDLQNAYNNRAVEGLAYSYNYAQKTYAYGLPIIPSIGVRGEF